MWSLWLAPNRILAIIQLAYVALRTRELWIAVFADTVPGLVIIDAAVPLVA